MPGDRLLADRSLTLEDIAKEEKMVPSYATRLFRLTLLAPNVVGAILNGNQPPELTARKLMDDTRLPLDWNEQRRALGFALGVSALLASNCAPLSRPILSFHSRLLARNAAVHAETAVPPKAENETYALSEPAFARRIVSSGPVPAALHDEATEKSREFALSK